MLLLALVAQGVCKCVLWDQFLLFSFVFISQLCFRLTYSALYIQEFSPTFYLQSMPQMQIIIRTTVRRVIKRIDHCLSLLAAYTRHITLSSELRLSAKRIGSTLRPLCMKIILHISRLRPSAVAIANRRHLDFSLLFGKLDIGVSSDSGRREDNHSHAMATKLCAWICVFALVISLRRTWFGREE